MIASLNRGDASAASAVGEPPALFTAMSRRPCASTMPSTSVATCSGSRTSQGLNSWRDCSGGVPAAHHDGGSCVGEPIGDGGADPLGAAGDEGHLSAEVDGDRHRAKVYQTEVHR